jgi:hypothetical protein
MDTDNLKREKHSDYAHKQRKREGGVGERERERESASHID